MKVDEAKVDEMTLALMFLTTFGDPPNSEYRRSWKGYDWDTMNRLHEAGYISDPVGKAKSVVLTKEGAERSRQLFEKYFTRDE